MGQVILQAALTDWNYFMASLPIKTGDRLAVNHADSENALVAIALDSIAADDFGGQNRLLPDPGERVIDLVELKAQLLVIGEMAAVTSAESGRRVSL